jgi:hypothetical protein
MTIVKIATTVRESMERQFPRSRKTLRNRCLLGSYVAWRICRQLGVNAVLVGGIYTLNPDNGERLRFGDPASIARKERPVRLETHCWIESKSRIYDITRTQFEPDAEPIAILRKPHKQYRGEARYDIAASEDVPWLHLSLTGSDEFVEPILRYSLAALGERPEAIEDDAEEIGEE